MLTDSDEVMRIDENSSDSEVQKYLEGQGRSSGNSAALSAQKVGPSSAATGRTSS
jgi:hypothetical protein